MRIKRMFVLVSVLSSPVKKIVRSIKSCVRHFFTGEKNVRQNCIKLIYRVKNDLYFITLLGYLKNSNATKYLELYFCHTLYMKYNRFLSYLPNLKTNQIQYEKLSVFLLSVTCTKVQRNKNVREKERE